MSLVSLAPLEYYTNGIIMPQLLRSRARSKQYLLFFFFFFSAPPHEIQSQSNLGILYLIRFES